MYSLICSETYLAAGTNSDSDSPRTPSSVYEILRLLESDDLSSKIEAAKQIRRLSKTSQRSRRHFSSAIKPLVDMLSYDSVECAESALLALLNLAVRDERCFLEAMSNEKNIWAGDLSWRDRTDNLMLGTSDWRPVHVTDDDYFLDFNVARKIPFRDKYMEYTRSSKYNWQLNGIRRLDRLFVADPRLELSTDDVRHLVGFLRLRDKPQLQGNVARALSNVALALALSNAAPNGVEVINNEAVPLLVPLIKSKCGNGWLQMQALKALTKIAYAVPGSREVVLKNGAVELLGVVVMSRLKRFDVIFDSATFLVAVCCGEPKLPDEKTKVVLRIVETLLGCDFEDAMPQTCSAFSYICDKRFVPIDKKPFKQLVQLISHDFPSVAVSSLEAVGNIVRWGEDEQVKFMIDEGVLRRLWNLLRHKYEIVRKEACMIIANIIARNRSWIKDINLANLICPLVSQLDMPSRHSFSERRGSCEGRGKCSTCKCLLCL